MDLLLLIGDSDILQGRRGLVSPAVADAAHAQTAGEGRGGASLPLARTDGQRGRTSCLTAGERVRAGARERDGGGERKDVGGGP